MATLYDLTGPNPVVAHRALVGADRAAALLADLSAAPAAPYTDGGMVLTWIVGPTGGVVHLDTPDTLGRDLDAARGAVLDWLDAWQAHLPGLGPWHPGGGVFAEQAGVVGYEAADASGAAYAAWHCRLCHYGSAPEAGAGPDTRALVWTEALRHLAHGHTPAPRPGCPACEQLKALDRTT